MSQGQPAWCTAITAFVRGVRHFSTDSAVRFWLSKSTSATTGFAPRMTAALAEAMNVRQVVTTSSPSPTPAACSANSSASEPFASAMACFVPARRASFSSNSSFFEPVQRFTFPLLSTSETARISASSKCGHFLKLSLFMIIRTVMKLGGGGMSKHF